MSDLAPCNPRMRIDACAMCRRYAPHLPHLAECRPSLIVIDATIVRRAGQCPLFQHSTVVAVDLPVQEAA